MTVKKTFLTLSMALCFLISGEAFMFGIVDVNQGGSVFCTGATPPNCPKTMGASESQQSYNIETLIECAAGYYLKAYSSYLQLLSKIEMGNQTEINITELKTLNNTVLDELSMCIVYQSLLVDICSATPYNPEAIEFLKNFDYQNYQKCYSLNYELFSEISSFLTEGKVIEMFKQKRSELLTLENKIIKFRDMMNVTAIPSQINLLDVYEGFSKISLKGQYAARIFSHL